MHRLTHIHAHSCFARKERTASGQDFSLFSCQVLWTSFFLGACYMLLSRLSNSAMKPVIETNWVELHLENCVAVGWNYGLQHRSFKMYLLRPVWTCPAVNL